MKPGRLCSNVYIYIYIYIYILNIKCLIFDVFLSVVLYNITVYTIVVTDNKLRDREI